MKIVFMGTPDFACEVLRSLNENGHEITAVVTQPDKPKGRSKELVASPVKQYAVANNIPVLQPVRIKAAEEVAQLKQYDADIYVVAAFGQILSKEILDIPKFGCINVHASLLPKYRGAAPIQWSIIDGEKVTGVTIVQMNEGLDTGDILTQAEVEITDSDTGESLHDKLAAAGAQLCADTLKLIENGNVTPTPQNNDESCYAKMLTKAMGEIEFNKSAEVIERCARALTPWPGSYTYRLGKTLKLFDIKVVADSELGEYEIQSADNMKLSTPGTVISAYGDKLLIRCGSGQISVGEIQPEGKKRMPVSDYLRGNAVHVGDRLGNY